MQCEIFVIPPEQVGFRWIEFQARQELGLALQLEAEGYDKYLPQAA